MKKSDIVKKSILSIIIFALIYAMHFLVFPALFEKWYPRSNEAYGLYIGSFLFIIIMSKCFLDLQHKYYIMGMAAYIIAVSIYNACGAYGIGLRGIALDGIKIYYDSNTIWAGVIIMSLIMLALYALVCVGDLLVRKFIKR